VGDKVYAPAYDAPTYDVILAYSCANDSPVAAVRTGVFSPVVFAYYPPLHKAYVGSDWTENKVVSYDCEHDTVLHEFNINYMARYHLPDYDAERGKLYLPSFGVEEDTLCTIDCRTDSIIRRTLLPYLVADMVMATRTDRLYLTISAPVDLIMVMDCVADTLLGPPIQTGWGPGNMAYDSVHNRVFVACQDSSICVLSDDTSGVAEVQLRFPLRWDVAIAPNTVIGRAVIHWQVPVEADVSLCVRDTAGRLVKVLANGRKKPGTYSSVWTGTDTKGQRLANGIYFCQMVANGTTQCRKMVLQR
jgi:DNA-binding beta-propeller fold protein YncE